MEYGFRIILEGPMQWWTIYICRYNEKEFSGISRETFFKAMQAEGVYTYKGYKCELVDKNFDLEKKMKKIYEKAVKELTSENKI